MSNPKDFAELSLDEFLDQLADRTPTPGGGGVTAVAGALATAMARMVAAYSITKKTQPDHQKQIEEAARKLHSDDQILRALITQDAVAYVQMTEAAKKVKENPDVQDEYQKTVFSAVGVPMEMAAVATRALDTMDSFKEIASKYLLSDLAVAAVFAEATVRAAQYTIGINLPQLSDDDMRKKISADIDQMLQRSRASRESIESFVRAHFE